MYENIQYTEQPKQFRNIISNFPAIKFKLAEQVIRAFANESTVYRISKDIERAIDNYVASGLDKGTANVNAQRDFAIEAALIKVYGSEMLDYIVDEGVQIHGGMGYSSETEIETQYRDSRINRIFEGTNEINRMVVSDSMIKKGTKKALDIIPAAEKVWKEIDNLTKVNFFDDYHEQNKQYITNFKKATLLITKLAIDKLGRKIAGEQEILFNLADMMMQVYVAESNALRIEKMDKVIKKHDIDLYKDILNVLQYESGQIIYKAGLDATICLAEENEQEKIINALNYFTKVKPFNFIDARRRIANKLIEDNRYTYSSY